MTHPHNVLLSKDLQVRVKTVLAMGQLNKQKKKKKKKKKKKQQKQTSEYTHMTIFIHDNFLNLSQLWSAGGGHFTM